MLRRQFMKGLAASPSALLLSEPKEEVFTWKPPVEILHETSSKLKAGTLFPEDFIICERTKKPYRIIFPKGRWQLAEAKFVKIKEPE